MDETAKILIVDDEPIGRQLLEAILFSEGYNLLFAEDGEMALNKTIENIPTVVLLDVMMPKMDGFEVCRKIRQNENTAHIPIFLITALDDRDSRIKGIDAGADDYISKPFDRVEILAKVKNRAILSKFRQRDTNRDNISSSDSAELAENPILTCVIEQLLSCQFDCDEKNTDIFRSKEISKSQYAYLTYPIDDGKMHILLSNKTEKKNGIYINCLLSNIINNEILNKNLIPSQIIQSTLEKIHHLASENKLTEINDASYSFIIVAHNLSLNSILVSGLNQTLFVIQNQDPLIKTLNNQVFQPFYLMGNQDLKISSPKEIVLFSENILEIHSQPDVLNFLNNSLLSGFSKPLSQIIPQKFNQINDIVAVKLSF